MTIGIDFSVNSTAVCIYYNGIYKFGVFYKNISKKILDKCSLFYMCKSDYFEIEKDDNLTIKERKETHNSLILAGNIRDWIASEIENLQYIGKIDIIFEGFSFGSTGSMITKIAGYQFIARHQLLCFIPLDNMHFLSPGTIKKWVGKGNMKKEQIIETVSLSNNPKIFWLVESLYSFKKQNNTWEKPIDDIVDSYCIVQTHLNQRI
jgi:hypothetical protein